MLEFLKGLDPGVLIGSYLLIGFIFFIIGLVIIIASGKEGSENLLPINYLLIVLWPLVIFFPVTYIIAGCIKTMFDVISGDRLFNLPKI